MHFKNEEMAINDFDIYLLGDEIQLYWIDNNSNEQSIEIKLEKLVDELFNLNKFHPKVLSNYEVSVDILKKLKLLILYSELKLGKEINISNLELAALKEKLKDRKLMKQLLSVVRQ